MGRFKSLVDTPVAVELFKAKYNIPEGVGLRYCPPENILTSRRTGEVVIPVIAFLEGGMTITMDSITRQYLRSHRLCPHQCAANMFRILGSVDALNQMMGLQLT